MTAKTEKGVYANQYITVSIHLYSIKERFSPTGKSWSPGFEIIRVVESDVATLGFLKTRSKTFTISFNLN